MSEIATHNDEITKQIRRLTRIRSAEAFCWGADFALLVSSIPSLAAYFETQDPALVPIVFTQAALALTVSVSAMGAILVGSRARHKLADMTAAPAPSLG